ncbi:hypothetical protein VTO42DRAFT_6436 [Malbranchea cinnamomea]
MAILVVQAACAVFETNLVRIPRFSEVLIDHTLCWSLKCGFSIGSHILLIPNPNTFSFIPVLDNRDLRREKLSVGQLFHQQTQYLFTFALKGVQAFKSQWIIFAVDLGDCSGCPFRVGYLIIQIGNDVCQIKIQRCRRYGCFVSVGSLFFRHPGCFRFLPGCFCPYSSGFRFLSLLLFLFQLLLQPRDLFRVHDSGHDVLSYLLPI